MKNVEIKLALKQANLKQWQLAELLGITEWTLSRWMRKELQGEKKQRIIEVIKNGK